MFKPLRILSSLALLVWATGCATTQTSHVDMLTEAGFKLVNADTPKKQELLKTLPAGHLSLITWKGKNFYVQPAATPNQAYVGTPKEYETYQGLRLAKQMRNDDLMAAQMNHTAMNQWNAWGPSFYGGFYGPYR
ncbi:MAG: hypothetical protein WAO00_06425 [Chthoniobacterales bacterium]